MYTWCNGLKTLWHKTRTQTHSPPTPARFWTQSLCQKYTTSQSLSEKKWIGQRRGFSPDYQAVQSENNSLSHNRLSTHPAWGAVVCEPRRAVVHSISYVPLRFCTVLQSASLQRIVRHLALYGLSSKVDVQQSEAGFFLEMHNWQEILLCHNDIVRSHLCHSTVDLDCFSELTQTRACVAQEWVDTVGQQQHARNSPARKNNTPTKQRHTRRCLRLHRCTIWSKRRTVSDIQDIQHNWSCSFQYKCQWLAFE